MPELNLNAPKAARMEAMGEPKVLVFGDPEERFELPPELLLEHADAFTSGDPKTIIASLVGAENLDRFMAQKPSIRDFQEFAEGLNDLYGIDVPESSASNGSSPRASSRSRPTSPASTG